MNDLQTISSISIVIPIIAWLLRRQRIENSFTPFIAVLFFALISEMLSNIYIRNAHIINTYRLFESSLLIYQFYRWRKSQVLKYTCIAIGSICGVIWLMENFFFGSLFNFHPVHVMVYSFAIVMLSINEINYLITHESRNLIKNPRFILCLSFMVYFTYKILLEGAYELSEVESALVSNNIFAIHSYVNLSTNIIYAVVIWMIPRKTYFTFNIPGSSFNTSSITKE